MIGDPKAKVPKGAPAGVPVVAGAAQTGYALATRGWMANKYRLMLPGDFIQIGYRFYKLRDQVDSNGAGNATLTIWPNLRDLPADGAAIQLTHCKGLFRLKNASGNKSSTNVGNYGVSGFAIREAI